MSRTRPRGDPEASSPAASAASSTPTPAKRQPPVLKDRVRPSKKFAEVAGGTAGCAAVCCCCPCGLVNLLVLTVVRLPAGLCKKALRKQRMKRKIAAGLSKKKKPGILVPWVSGVDGPTSPPETPPPPPAAAEAAEMELERKMWAEFHSTGFWRSLSQREERT